MLLGLCAIAASAGFTGARMLSASARNSLPSLSAVLQKPSPASERLERFSESESPPKAESLSAYTRWAEQAGSPVDAKRAFLQAIQKLPVAELRELVSRELSTGFLWEIDTPEFEIAVRRLAQLDPEKAASLWAESRFLSQHHAVHAEWFLGSWIHRDSDAFLKWFGALPSQTQIRANQFVLNFSISKPELLAAHAEWFAALPGSRIDATIARSLTSLLSHSENSGAWQNALETMQTFPNGPLKHILLASLAFSGRLEPSDPEVQNALASVDPSSVLSPPKNFIEQLPPGPLRFESIRRQFLTDNGANDLNDHRKTLSRYENTPDYDAAALGFVEFCSRVDAEHAAQGISLALSFPPDSDLRLRALDVAAGGLYKADPEAARKWVKEAALSEKEFFQLTGKTKSQR
jgi:hypothetical protein